MQQKRTMKFEDGLDKGCTSDEDSIGKNSAEKDKFKTNKPSTFQQRSCTVDQQKNRPNAQMVQDKTFKVDSPLKITQTAMLSPLSKTQNSFMKSINDQDI